MSGGVGKPNVIVLVTFIRPETKWSSHDQVDTVIKCNG